MWFFNTQNTPKINRSFNPNYLLDFEAQKHFEEFGYVIIKDIIKEEIIQEAALYFEELKTMEGYNVNNKFESSGNFTSKKVQEFVFSRMNMLMQKITPHFANLNNCDIGDGGAFFVKPNSNDSILHPHQDSAVIDETKYYGIFVWIPLIDITEDNGPLYILPTSHLWGNCYRSQHINWAFREQYKYLWKKMIPLTVNKGDVICFDTSIIHASGVNRSSNFRVAACGALLPKNHQKVEFLLDKKEIFKYYINDEYWLDGGKASTLKNYPYDKETYLYPNPISKKSIKKLLNEYHDKSI